MVLVLIVLTAAVLGFYYGYETDGFIFSSDICLFAGLSLIMPSLFQTKLSDIRLLWIHKRVVLKSLFLNYLLLPATAAAIGIATGNFGIASGLFLVSVLSGGGMVMFWIKKSQGDASLGFVLLFVNLLLVGLSFLMYYTFTHWAVGYFDADYESEINMMRFIDDILWLLVALPYLVSRVIVYEAKPVLDWIRKHKKAISQISIFLIIFYLFGLQDTQYLIEIFDFEPELFVIALFAVLAFYLATYLLSRLIFDLKNPLEIAAFWHSVTRYLTLALVIATFSIHTVGVSMMLPVVFGYLVQIPLAAFIDKLTFSKNGR